MDAINRLRFNCEYIKKYCINNKNSSNENLFKNCEMLLESGELVDRIAKGKVNLRSSKKLNVNNNEIMKENLKKDCSNEELNEKSDQESHVTIFKKISLGHLPTNGFILFLVIITSFTDRIVNQIKDRNQIDRNLLKLFTVMFLYRDFLMRVYESLVKELEIDSFNESSDQKSKKSKKSKKFSIKNLAFLSKELDLSDRICYDVLHLDEKIAQILYSHNYVAFWLDEMPRKAMKFLLAETALLSRLPYTTSALWNKKESARFYVKATKNANLDYPFNIWQSIEGWFVSSTVNFIVNRNVPVSSKTMYVPKQNRFRLDYKGNILDFDNMTKEEIDSYNNDEEEQIRQTAPGKRFRNDKNTIRCRYSCITSKEKVIESLKRIKNKNKINKILKYCTTRKNSDQKPDSNIPDSLNEAFDLDKSFEVNPEQIIILNQHGGGFFCAGSTSAEIYLRDLCNNLCGIPILSIDYSLTVPYPIPNQEILDVYLWCMSGKDEVKQKLGFHPKKIVLSGDSAGGFLTISLLIILNELNKLINDSSCIIPLPISIVLPYPLCSLENCTPSKAMGTVEPFVEIHLLMIIYSLYGGNVWSNEDFKKIKNSKRYKQIEDKNRNLFVDENDETHSRTINSNDSSPWYQCDYRTYKNRVDYINTFFNHPFISPKLYASKFSELKDISLYTMVGDLDPAIDDCIEFARLWEGKTCLDIFKKINHGFMMFGCLSENAREATQLTFERYQEACGLL